MILFHVMQACKLFSYQMYPPDNILLYFMCLQVSMTAFPKIISEQAG